MDRERERIRRIRVTPRNNDFQEIFTFRSEKMAERNGEKWARKPTTSSPLSFSLLCAGRFLSAAHRNEWRCASTCKIVGYRYSSVSDVSRARNAVSTPTWLRGNPPLKQCVPRRVHERWMIMAEFLVDSLRFRRRKLDVLLFIHLSLDSRGFIRST